MVLKAVTNPGDEIIAAALYFVEYGFYAENHGGTLVEAKCGPDFPLRPSEYPQRDRPEVRAIIVNSPNNPTGRVYPAEVFTGLAEVLGDRPDISVISDELIAFVHDGREVPLPCSGSSPTPWWLPPRQRSSRSRANGSATRSPAGHRREAEVHQRADPGHLILGFVQRAVAHAEGVRRLPVRGCASTSPGTRSAGTLHRDPG